MNELLGMCEGSMAPVSLVKSADGEHLLVHFMLDHRKFTLWVDTTTGRPYMLTGEKHRLVRQQTEEMENAVAAVVCAVVADDMIGQIRRRDAIVRRDEATALGAWFALRRIQDAGPDLLAALKHMQGCRPCAEGAWDDCQGGRLALEAIARAESVAPEKSPMGYAREPE